jgi:hypothetical protein
MTTVHTPSMLNLTNRYLKLLLVGLLILTLASAGFAIYRDRQNREAVAADQIIRVAEQMAARLDRFFNPVAEDLLLIRQWSLNGALSALNPERLAAKLSPLMQNHGQVHGFILWEQGRLSAMLLRDGGALLMGYGSGDGRNPLWTWQSRDADGAVTDQWPESTQTMPGYLDAWQYAPALSDQGQMAWAPTTSLPPSGASGLYAAIGWQKDGRSGAAAAGVLNTQIAQLFDDIRSGASYRFFLFQRNGLFIDFQNPAAASAPPRVTGNTGAAMSDPLLNAAHQAWRQHGEIDVPFGFRHAGAPVYGLIHGLQGSRQQTGIGVIASEADLLRHLPLNRFFFVPVVLGLLWLALLAVALRMRRLAGGAHRNKPLQAMTETELLQLIDGGETDTVEFKSTLRWNLKSGKAGKEIELACLKTVAAFMNAEGGTLLVGVADDGAITGIAADNFSDDDKYLRHFSTIFEQHIGLEFSEFLEFILMPLNGEQVLAVRCRPSPRPVFVTHKKDEMFFIRSGPSSRQLTTSRTLAYLEERRRGDKQK